MSYVSADQTPEQQLEDIKDALRAPDASVVELHARLEGDNDLVGNDYADAVDHLAQAHFRLTDIKGQLGAVAHCLNESRESKEA